MEDKLLVDDVRFYGQHGVRPAERDVGAWFSVDAELVLDLASAALSDDPAATVDYALVVQRIVDIGTRQRVNLLERLAGLIADTLLRDFPADRVRVRVRKLTPPLGGMVGIPGVELVRRR